MLARWHVRRDAAVTPAIRLGASYGALFLLAAFGLFSHLDDRRLWGDEAETAVLALNIMRFGVPQVDDGRNVIANLPNRADSNDAGIWTWSPWLDEYVAAGSLALLGPTTLAARLPFATLALVSALALARVTHRATRSHPIALMALALYTTSVPFLLHGRQARYYAILCLAEIWLLHGLLRCLGRGEAGESSRHMRVGALHIALALSALFYCNYIVIPGNLIALAGVATLFWIREGRAPVALGAGIAGFALLALPWIAYAPPSGQLGRMGFQHFGPSFRYYATEIHFHFVPWIVLALPVASLALRRRRSDGSAPNADASRDLETFVWLLLLASLFVYALSPLRFFRYLIPLTPPLFFLTAALIGHTFQASWARVACVAVLVSSNLVAIATAPFGSHRLGLPYLDFARSVTTEYDERLDDVLAFLEKSSSDRTGDATRAESLWVADPEFPLMFYTDLRIIDARYHDFPEDPPDWVFATSASGIANRRPLQLPVGMRSLYDATALRVRRSPRGGNRPDPHAHAWLEVGEAESEKMLIYRRR